MCKNSILHYYPAIDCLLYFEKSYWLTDVTWSVDIFPYRPMLRHDVNKNVDSLRNCYICKCFVLSGKLPTTRENNKLFIILTVASSSLYFKWNELYISWWYVYHIFSGCTFNFNSNSTSNPSVQPPQSKISKHWKNEKQLQRYL